MDQTSIRLALPSDLNCVFEIVRASSDWMKKQYGFTYWDEYYSLEKIKENFKKLSVFILLENNKPVATYSVGDICPTYYTQKDLSHFNDKKAPAYYMTTLCVLPQSHGKGYAKILINHLENMCKQKGVKYIRFDARGIYTELINFYKKLGYKVVGELLDEGDIYNLFEKEL